MNEIRQAVYGSVSGLMAGMLGGLVAGFLFGLVITIFSTIESGELTKSVIVLFLIYPSVAGLIIGSLLGGIIGAIVPSPSYRLMKISQIMGGFVALLPSFLFLYLANSIIHGCILIFSTFIAGMVGGTVAGRFYRSIFS
jgi:fructose-specific phosphotransferase system IIC component